MSAPAVETRDLFCFHRVPDGSVAALRGLSIAVAHGEKLLVHGPNGAGKTTFLRVLMGLQAPDAGSVRVGGVDLAGADDSVRTHLRRTTLGIVDQRSSRTLRPELSVVDNVALGLRIAGEDKGSARKRARATLAALDLAHLGDRSPAFLSGGEAQRVAVCAAIVHGPHLVLADEPTGELDTASAAQVYDLLRDAVTHVGASLVLVTHDDAAARVVDRVVRIRDGRLSEQWAPTDPDDETLVVDDRGWVRLPETLRRRTGSHNGVAAEVVEGNIVLRGRDAASEPVPANGSVRSSDEASAVERAAVACSVETITVAFGERRVMEGVNVQVRAGELTVVSGRSGTGKSTLLRVMAGLTEPESGRVILTDVRLADLDRSARAALRRNVVAFAGQSAAVADALTVAENLLLARRHRGRAADDGAVSRVLEQLGLTALRDRVAHQLSGGERQRVALGRALVAGVPLIIADEPTSHQDELHAGFVADALRGAARAGAAVVCASHDPVLIAAAGQVIELGRLA